MTLYYILLILLLLSSGTRTKKMLFNYPSDIWEDSNLETPQLVTKYGYPSEEHEIETEDGYILQMHRIKNINRKPILLLHGVTDSSAVFVLMGPHVGLGYYLWRMGYDVWMGNVRGNRYSQKHCYLNSIINTEYWKFSWHEIGIYDLPAMIDYILNLTKFQKLFYIGHSQGTTIFFVMCSKKPEYNSKIKLMQAIAPVGYVTHVKTILYYYLNTLLKVLPKDFLQKISLNHAQYKNVCTSNLLIENTCINILESAIGKGEEINQTTFPVILGHIPAGFGIRQLEHFIQNKNSKKFQEYNYGLSENLLQYGNINPPEYNLSIITAPIIFHYTLNDLLADPIDVNQTYNELGNPKGIFLTQNSKWNHMDFLWSKDAPKLFYNKLLNFIYDYENF